MPRTSRSHAPQPMSDSSDGDREAPMQQRIGTGERDADPDAPSGDIPTAGMAGRSTGRSRGRRTGPDTHDRSQADPAAPGADGDGDGEDEPDIAADLSFREAQTALELSLAQLQDPNLDVEAMAGLYRRARRYADRCEQLLAQVEQEILLWDPQQPDMPPAPYNP